MQRALRECSLLAWWTCPRSTKPLLYKLNTPCRLAKVTDLQMASTLRLITGLQNAGRLSWVKRGQGGS